MIMILVKFWSVAYIFTIYSYNDEIDNDWEVIF
jgi:hypothetical protein